MLRTNLYAFKHLNKRKVTLISKSCCCQKANEEKIDFLVAHLSQAEGAGIDPRQCDKIHSRCFHSFVLKTLQPNASGVEIKKMNQDPHCPLMEREKKQITSDVKI